MKLYEMAEVDGYIVGLPRRPKNRRSIKIHPENLRMEKTSPGWVYAGWCCPYDANPGRWAHRGGHQKNAKRKKRREFRNNIRYN